MGRRRIDWGAAKVAYVSDPRRTYGVIARSFGVSEAAVRQHANAEGWRAQAAEFDRKAEERALAAEVKTRDRHILEASKLRDLTFTRLTEKAVADTLDVKIPDAVAIGRYVELLTGEATDRVELGEIREFVSVLFVRVATLIEPSRRPDYLALIHELEGQLPAGGEQA